MKIKRLTDHNNISFTPEELPILIINDTTTNPMASDSDLFPCYDLYGRVNKPKIAPKLFVLFSRGDEYWHQKQLCCYVHGILNQIWYSHEPKTP